MDQSIELIDSLLIQLKSGRSLLQALSQTPWKKMLHPNYQNEWNRSLQNFYEKGTSSLEGLESLRDYIASTELQKQLLENAFRIPTLQAYTSVAIGIFWVMYAEFFFPDALRPGLNIVLLSALLLISGIFTTKFLIGYAKRQTWISNWILFLSRLRFQIQNGFTFESAFYQITKLEMNLPYDTKLWLRYLKQKLSGDDKTPQSPKHKSPGWQLIQMKLLEEFILRRDPTSELLLSFIESAQSTFKSQLQKTADRLSFYLLLPLVFLIFPAISLVLVYPFLRELLNFLKQG